MEDFVERFWEVVNEEYDYRDMLTFDEIQKIFDRIKVLYAENPLMIVTNIFL